ncbi:MAG: lipoprotein [Rubrivivax sp.]
MSATSVAARIGHGAGRLGKVLLLVSAIAAAGCGQKGPLTLPSAAAASAASAAHR